MTARLLILLALAVGLGVFFLVTDRTVEVPDVPQEGIAFEEDLDEIRARQKMIWQQGIECEQEAPTPAEISVQVWLDPADGKNRLYYALTEANGYYVDTITLTFWYKENENVQPEDSPLVIDLPLNNYIPPNEPLNECLDVVWAELQSIGGDMGASENWAGRVEKYYLACLGNPKFLPIVTKATSCD